jgi:hypothetical protein
MFERSGEVVTQLRVIPASGPRGSEQAQVDGPFEGF